MEQGLRIDNEISKIGLELSRARDLAKRQRLLSLLRAKKARLGISDLFYFAKHVLGYKDVALQPHWDMCRNLSDKEVLRKLNLEPRGCFKTTLTIAYVIQRIVQNPDIRVMIDCEDLSLSKKILGEIKTHFERNYEFRALYGDYVINSAKWSETEIVVNRRTAILKDPTINTSSVEVNRVGAHVDLLVEDDLHSLLNTKSPEQILKVVEHWQANQSILDPGGEEIINGTKWAVMDLYGVIIEQEKARRKEGRKKFNVRIKNAEISGPGNTLYFPTRLTTEFLEDKKLEQGSYIYSCQYKNNAIDDSAIIFKRHWIKFYGRYAPERLVITGTLDPAISQKDDACFTNINILGTDLDGFMYLLDNRRFKALPHEIIDAVFAMHNKWPTMKEFGIETVAYQKALKYWLYERMRQTGVFLNIKELKTDSQISKDMRIKALIPYVESGTIQFPGTGPQSLDGGMLDLYNEMVEFPVGAYVDALDSLSYQLQLYAPASPERRKESIERTFQTIMQQERKRRVAKSGDGLPLLGQNNYRNADISSFPAMQMFQEVSL